jgi:class 3 adenylate cyclase
LRAARCGIALQTELVALRREMAAPPTELAMSIAVTSGAVVTSAASGGDYLVMGGALDLARRIVPLVPPGQVWVNQANAERLPLYMGSEMLNAFGIRGYRDPVAPFRIWPPP